MKIKCLAIDDEPLALTQISSYIEKTPFLEAVALCQSAFEAMDYLAENEVDLMFVDISMPDLNGMDFVKSLADKPQIIFTTAYSEYALEGFQVDALDYILKPISYANFLKAATKAKTWFEINQKQKETIQTTQDSLFVKSEYKYTESREGKSISKLMVQKVRLLRKFITSFSDGTFQESS